MCNLCCRSGTLCPHIMSETFWRSEIVKIVENPDGYRLIWLAFLDNARQPFYELCDLLSRGDGFSEAASITERKSAAGCLFASFAGIFLNQEELPINVAISFEDVCAGLQTISESWSKFTADELLTVALLLDLSSEGSVSHEDFLNFINLANDSLKQDPQKSRECFDTLYDCLTERIRGSITGTNNSTIFSQIPSFNDVTKILKRSYKLPIYRCNYLFDQHDCSKFSCHFTVNSLCQFCTVSFHMIDLVLYRILCSQHLFCTSYIFFSLIFIEFFIKNFIRISSFCFNSRTHLESLLKIVLYNWIS